jgi:hypothetical protein
LRAFKGSIGIEWLLLSLLVLAYPLMLRSAYGSAELLAKATAAPAYSALLLSYAAALGGAYALPAIALLSAMSLSGTSIEHQVARFRMLHLMFAAPPIFTGIGVLCFIVGAPNFDFPAWILFWTAMVLGSHTRSAGAVQIISSARISLEICTIADRPSKTTNQLFRNLEAAKEVRSCRIY